MTNPLSEALVFLVNIVSQFYISLVLLRFLMQWVRADFYNPLAQFIVHATNPLLRPLRRVIPSIYGLDVASLLLAWILQFVFLAVALGIQGQFGALSPLAIAWMSLITLVMNVLHIYLAATFLLFVVSWLAPYNESPLTVLIYQLTKPLTSRIRRVLPPFHGVDFSLAVVCIGIYLIKIVVLLPLMSVISIL